MMWIHELPWHWLESFAMVLFWGLVIVLALVPINYLRDQLNSPEMSAPPGPEQIPAAMRESGHGKT
jgi:hypothetical protein